MNIKPVMLIVLLVSTTILTSCLKTYQLEKMGIINARGIDLTDNGDIKATLILFQFEAEATDITKLVKGTASTTKGAIDNANMETNFTLDSGKVQFEMYGMEAAEKGIMPYLDTLARDPNTPDTMFLAVSKTTAEDVFSVQQSGISMNIGQYLYGVIESSATDDLFPQVTLVKFLGNYNDVGIDPILPIFDIVEGVPKITSIAAFKNDKLAGELPLKYQDYFNFLVGRIRGGWVEVSIPSKPFEKYLKDKSVSDDEINTTLNVFSTKPDIKVTNMAEKKFNVNLEVEAGLMEISQRLDVGELHVLKKLEKEMEKVFLSNLEDILLKTKELGIDPIGFGSIYRMKVRDKPLTDKQWREIYPEIEVDFNVNVKILQHGETFE
ncbi:Ger(x)C family spore germination protein [Virgibacillus halodenitrificans]|nr:Ger(x)C family spore germination protein [Virgibacillus halodenitrificans]